MGFDTGHPGSRVRAFTHYTEIALHSLSKFLFFLFTYLVLIEYFVPMTHKHKCPLFSKTSNSSLRKITCCHGNFNSWTGKQLCSQFFFFFFENLLRPCTLDETLNLSTPHFLVCKMDFLQILALNEMM